MPRARLGVALLVPPPVAAEVDGLRRAMGDGSLGRIPAHLTLVPPVNVRHLDDAVAVMRRAAHVTRPFVVELGPPATFLPHNPVLFLAVGKGAEHVRALRDRVFVPPLARSLTWSFVPHVTVADDVDGARVEAGLAALASYRVEVTFERVHLLRERPGRVWEPIGDAAFAAPAVIGRGGLPVEIEVSQGLPPGTHDLVDREWVAYDAARYGEDVRRPDSVVLTARRDGDVAGVALGRMGSGSAHLSELLVVGAQRGEGIGSHLLAAFESEAARRACPLLRLRTEADGPAVAFYRHRGWWIEATFERYRFGRAFVQMRKDLSTD